MQQEDTIPERMVPTVGSALTAAILAVMALIIAMEVILTYRGVHATGIDDPKTWLAQRARASDLGSQAIILVGASRIQTDIDQDALRRITQREPVQLAIDGASFLPVLEDLANDATVTGTILVSYEDAALADTRGTEVPIRLVTDFERSRDRAHAWDFAAVEHRLDTLARTHMRSFADGAQPVSTLFSRILTLKPLPQYSTFLPDRSRLSDYALVDTTAMYFWRVLRDLDWDVTFPQGSDLDAVTTEIRDHIATMPSIAEDDFLNGAEKVVAWQRKIERRGGHVHFVKFPTGGLITELEEHRCPRQRCWDRFTALSGAMNLNFQDVASLRTFPVPDGSHIDFRNRRELTLTIAPQLHLQRVSDGSPD